jgi:hypothetical protein
MDTATTRGQMPLSDRSSWTPDEYGRFVRKSPDWVRKEIRAGRLGALAIRDRGGKVRFTILREHHDEFVRAHTAAPPPKPPRRKRRPAEQIDFFPDL